MAVIFILFHKNRESKFEDWSDPPLLTGGISVARRIQRDCQDPCCTAFIRLQSVSSQLLRTQFPNSTSLIERAKRSTGAAARKFTGCRWTHLLLLVLILPLQADLCGSDQTGGVTNEPPNPSGTPATLWVEVDTHSRLIDPQNTNDPRDLVQYVQQWKGALLEGSASSGCSHRFDGATAEFDVRPGRSQTLNWTSTTIVVAAVAAGFTADETGVVHLLQSYKSQTTALPNLYLAAAEYYDDPSGQTYPWSPNRYLALTRGIDFDDNSACSYATGVGFPVGAVFVSEIEKFVDEMNEFTNQHCGFYYFDLTKVMARTVAHELFHELFISSPYEYYPPSPNLYCHDGDTVCKCIMNQMEPVYILDLIGGITPQCMTANGIITNWENPCMERAHDTDGCSLQDIVDFNQAGN